MPKLFSIAGSALPSIIEVKPNKKNAYDEIELKTLLISMIEFYHVAAIDDIQASGRSFPHELEKERASGAITLEPYSIKLSHSGEKVLFRIVRFYSLILHTWTIVLSPSPEGLSRPGSKT